MAVSSFMSFDSQHNDMIHDARMDYFGRRLATASSDKTIRIFDISYNKENLEHVLRGHQTPVWQVCWAHPKFGTILASCSYDGLVLIWQETSNHEFSIIYEHRVHKGSVNSIDFGPPAANELSLACGSSDETVSIITLQKDGSWKSSIIRVDSLGVYAVSWYPIPELNDDNTKIEKKIVTGGADGIIRFWKFADDDWELETSLNVHTDWIRDLAFAPIILNRPITLASCSQDKTVLIHTKNTSDNSWVTSPLNKQGFKSPIWGVSWNLAGNVLAVSSGENKVSIWRETPNNEYELVNSYEEETFEKDKC